MTNTDGNRPLFVYVSDSVRSSELPSLHFDSYAADNDNFGGGGTFLCVAPSILEAVRLHNCKIIYEIPEHRRKFKRGHGYIVPTRAEIALIEVLMIMGMPESSEYEKLRKEIYPREIPTAAIFD